MKKRVRKDGWYIQRGYAHLDKPLKFEAASSLVKNAKKIENLSFFPFLGYTDKKRKFGRDNSLRSLPKKSRPKIIKIKDRDLKFASHRDAYIYSYYNHTLGNKYEELLKQETLSDSVVGYRKGLGSNIDISSRAFSEICARGNCRVFCFDIKDFFPSIPHRALKMALSKVLGVRMLPVDWYNVYRSMTRYSWIDIDQLFLWCLIDPRNAPNPLCNDPITLLEDLRDAKMIRSNRLPHGIPQGAPISAIFANIAMLEFDLAARRWADNHDSIYMRYSDDIIFITPDETLENMNTLVDALLNDLGTSIKVGHDKTEVSSFLVRADGKIGCDKPITYLGFTFDGQTVRLRARTLSRYYRRMTYSTRRTGSVAYKALKKGGNPDPFKRALIRDFSHLGRANFYSYAKRAQNTFGGDAIRKQLRNHFRILMRKLENRGR